jgi:membrane-associated phospholipid phosphatase
VGIIVGALVSFLTVFAVLFFFHRRKRPHTKEDEGKLKNSVPELT